MNHLYSFIIYVVVVKKCFIFTPNLGEMMQFGRKSTKNDTLEINGWNPKMEVDGSDGFSFQTADLFSGSF